MAPVRGHVGLARRDHVDAVADVALADDRCPGLDDGRNAVASQTFDRRCWKRFEQRGPSKQCEVVGGNPSADVHRPQAPTEGEAYRGHDHAGDRERPSWSRQRDERRSRERAEPLAPHVDGLEHAEGPRELLVRDQSLQHRPARHVVQDGARAREAEQDRCERGNGTDRRHGNSVQERPRSEGREQAFPTSRDDRDGGADHPADAERGVQRADPRLSDPEHVERQDDDEGVDEPQDEGPEPEGPDQRPRPRIRPDVPEPRAHLTPHRRRPAPGIRRWRLAAHPGQQHGADGEEHGECRVHEPGPPDAEGGTEREEGRREKRTEQDAQALDQAGRRVGGGELRRVAREPGQQGAMRRPHEREEPADGAGGGVDQDRGRVEQGRDGGKDARGAHRRLGEQEDLLSREPVTEDRTERRDHRRGDQLDQGDDPDRRRTALGEREHHQGDEARPLADAERHERELRASEVGVAERGHEGSSRDRQVAPDLG